MANPQQNQVMPRQPAQAPAAPPPPVEAPPPAAAGNQLTAEQQAELASLEVPKDDSITISRTELDAILSGREAVWSAKLDQVRAEALQQAGAIRQTGKLVKGPDVKRAGDVRCRALRDIAGIVLGGRTYQCPSQEDLWMDKSHANELSTGPHGAAPYVLIVR